MATAISEPSDPFPPVIMAVPTSGVAIGTFRYMKCEKGVEYR
jgi:hypothetical protein